MTELTDLSETDDNNTTITTINIAEGCNPSNVNNGMRATLGLIRRAFKSSIFRLRDSTDQTKLVAVDLSGLTTATTRTHKVPNHNGTLLSQAVGSAIASASSIDLGAASGSTVHITGTTTMTALGTADAGIEKTAIFDGILTLTHNATSLILPGAANITTAAGDAARFVSEGSGNWKCVSYQRVTGAIALGTPVASTSGMTIDFTSIPAGVKRVTVFLTSVSLSGTASTVLQIGDSGGIENTGYTGASFQTTSGGFTSDAFSSSFLLTTGSDAGAARIGAVVLELTDPSINRWSCRGLVGSTSDARVNQVVGYKNLSATLDRVRISSSNGADTFDGGQVNISWE